MRTWRAISIVAEALGLGVVLGLATAGGVVLHMGMPAPRRFVAARVNGILGGALAGKVTIGRVGSLHLTHVEGVDAQVFDPEGHLVLDVRGLRARFGTFGLLRSVVTAKRLVVDVPEISIDGVEVVLEENAAGELGLQRAFDSRAPTTSAPSRGTYLTVGAIEVRHAWARGHLAVMPVIDADLKDLAGGLASTPAGTALDVRHLVVVGRGLPGMSPAGLVVASAFLPSNEAGELRVNARYDGRLGDIPVRADGSLTGKVVAGSVDVPETDPAAFAALAPGRLHLGAPLRARATVHGDLPVLEADLRAHVGAGGLTASATVTLPEGDRSELRASARVNADSLDVSLLETRAPPSKLTTLLEASIVSYPGGKLTGTYRVESQVGELGGQVVPAIAARGELTEDSIRGTAEIAEIGAPTDVRFALRPRAGGTSPDHLEFMLRTKAAALDAIPRVGALARGRARVSVEGSLELDTLLIAARADGDVLGLERSGVALSSARLTANVHGLLTAPRFEAELRGANGRDVPPGTGANDNQVEIQGHQTQVLEMRTARPAKIRRATSQDLPRSL